MCCNNAALCACVKSQCQFFYWSDRVLPSSGLTWNILIFVFLIKVLSSSQITQSSSTVLDMFVWVALISCNVCDLDSILSLSWANQGLYILTAWVRNQIRAAPESPPFPQPVCVFSPCIFMVYVNYLEVQTKHSHVRYMGHCGAAEEPGCSLVWPPRSRSHLPPVSFHVVQTFISAEATGLQLDECFPSMVQFLQREKSLAALRKFAFFFFHLNGCDSFQQRIKHESNKYIYKILYMLWT